MPGVRVKHLACLASYTEDGHDTQLVDGYVSVSDLADFAAQLREFLTTLPAGPPVVVDVEAWRAGDWMNADPMAAELAALLAQTDFGQQLDRFDIARHLRDRARSGPAKSEEHLRTLHFTFRPGDESDSPKIALYRNMHPMIAERLDLWRLSNFNLERLPSAEDIYLFQAVASDNAKDERLIALAEVRDLTPARSSAGRTIGFPHLEGDARPRRSPTCGTPAAAGRPSNGS